MSTRSGSRNRIMDPKNLASLLAMARNEIYSHALSDTTTIKNPSCNFYDQTALLSFLLYFYFNSIPFHAKFPLDFICEPPIAPQIASIPSLHLLHLVLLLLLGPPASTFVRSPPLLLSSRPATMTVFATVYHQRCFVVKLFARLRQLNFRHERPKRHKNQPVYAKLTKTPKQVSSS